MTDPILFSINNTDWLQDTAAGSFELVKDRFVIAARLKDQELNLIFDTGASNIIIHLSIANERSLKVLPRNNGIQLEPGKVHFDETEPLKLELLGETTPNAQLYVCEYPANTRPDHDGVLGWPIARKHIWLLSGSTSKLMLLRGIPRQTKEWLKLDKHENTDRLCLKLPKEFLGQQAYIGIDTGARSGVKLFPDAWTKWRTDNPDGPVTINAYYMKGVGEVAEEEFWAEEIDLAGLKLTNVPVTRANETEISSHPPQTFAKLGLTAMMRLDTVLHHHGDIAYLQPSNTPPTPYEHNRLGAAFVEKAGDLVARVAKNSPATEAGIQDADVLLKIDELEVRTKSKDITLTSFWQKPAGTKLHLTLLRNGKTVTADVVLRNILGPASK